MFDVMLLQGPGSQYRSMVDQLKGVPSSRGVESQPNSLTHSKNPSSSPSQSTPPQDTAAQQFSSDGDSFQRSETSQTDSSSKPGESKLTESQEQEVEKLKARDQEVKRHEQAHASAAGGHSRGISYEYTTGPDQAQYATSGHVDIDISPVSGDPEATVDKMQTIQRAALAPEEPSSKDRQVQSDAQKMEMEARQEIQEEDQEEANPESNVQSNEQPNADTNAQYNAQSNAALSSNPYQQAHRSQMDFTSQLQSKINLVA